MIRFDSIAARGVGPFRDEIRVNLASIAGRLVAVTGENGAGKSTLLELLAGAVYRECPTRGSLASLATSRDSFVEVRAVNGAPWTIRQTVDAISGKGESMVLDALGVPALTAGKVREFDAWRAAHLPPAEVLYASTFAVQGSAGFLEMKPAERKALLLRVLGIERLERLAEVTRERARDAREAMQRAAARVAEVSAGCVDVATAECELRAAELQAASWDERMREAQEAARVARSEAARIEALVDAVRAAREYRVELDGKRRAAEGRLADLQARAKNNAALLERADEIRGAARRAAELQAEREKAVADYRGADGRAGALAETEVQVEREIREKRARALALRDRLQRARDVLRGREAVREAASGVFALEAGVDTASAAVDAAQRALDRLRSRRLAGAEQRLGGLRDALGQISRWRDACHEHDEDMGYEPRDFDEDTVAEIERAAADTLRKDDEAVTEAREAPAAIAAAEAALRSARENLAHASDALRIARDRAARLPAIEAAERDEQQLGEELSLIEVSLVELEHRRGALAADRLAALEARTSADYAASGVARQLAELERVLRQVPLLDAAEGRLAELAPQVERAREELAALEREIATLPASASIPPAPDVRAADERAAAAEESARRAHGAVALAQRQLEQSRVSAARLAELAAESSALETEHADLTRLAADFGRDGLQAMEIDAAGPELSAMINDLLHACVSSRFTVTIDTTRISADGKRTLEGLEVTVLDTERGREAPVETFSGGERVLIGEAVSLALAMLAARRSGMEGVTLVRDESGAALDPERARSYVAMLRRAADLVGASRVLLVSHSPEVVELCDARIEIAGGKVEVRA